MTRFRSFSRRPAELALGALLVATACATGSVAPRFETTTSLSDDPRRAAGVAVDPATELPPASPQADSEQSLVVLRAPPDPESAREMVREFFRAISRRSYSELEALVRQDAWLQAGAMSGRQNARQFWRTRLSRLDYGALSGSTVYRDSELETYRAQDVPKLRPPRALGVSASGDDVVVRVPIASPRNGKTRLFGDEILFVLRPERGRYGIVEMAEDFSLP
jgi:hypothetical protein